MFKIIPNKREIGAEIVCNIKKLNKKYFFATYNLIYFSIQKMNIIYYKLSDYYNPKFEDGICYNDKDVNAKWPKTKLIVSKKDKLLGSFRNFKIKYKGL